MTVGDVRSGDAPAQRRVKTKWKVVMAADLPWRGTVYETRAGQQREEFCGPGEFLEAVARLTGWPIPGD